VSDPRTEYGRRLAAREAAVAAAEARSKQISNLRLVAFVAAAVTLVLALRDGGIALAWVAAPLLAFVALVIVHEAVHRRRARALLAVGHYRRALRRLDDAWRGEGVQRRDLAPPEHPYAADLDLFGPGSLFALLCTARTRGGQAILAERLLRPAAPDEIRTRQQAVIALRERVDLREDLALLGGDVALAVEPALLTAWGEGPRIDAGRLARLRALASLLGSAGIIALILALATEVGWTPLVVVAAFEGLVARSLQRDVAPILAALEETRSELDVLARLLHRLEREPTGDSRRLAELRRRIDGGAAAIARLARIVDWLEVRRSVLAPITFLLMWELHVAIAVERWRHAHGPAIAGWLAALGEFEAVGALAAYAYERPDAPMPTILEAGPRVRAEELRHPLLRGCVPNSIDLGDPVRVLMISGSNMSGKSTLLRTLGVNVVLAHAGAPVAARAMSLSPVQLGATLRIEDSLQGGVSRFYSELRRLCLLRDLARASDPPLLFLLDEIFHGTNSHDRKIGAEAVLVSLVEAGAIGLCTTHDLALAEAISALGERALNVHFQDEVEDGALVFDYRVRPGIVRRSNAIALMRAIGLLDGGPRSA
jgi:hypothetical protein